MKTDIFLMVQRFNPFLDRKKIKLKSLIFTAVFIVFLSSISFANPFENVLIISIDALHPKALGQKTSTNIYTLMEKGSYTLNGNSTTPPLTLLSHTAMFTGLEPSESGKTDNVWQQGQKRVTKKPSLTQQSLWVFQPDCSIQKKSWVSWLTRQLIFTNCLMIFQ